jgi:hypothetical protein
MLSSLAGEFAKCEDARITLMDTNQMMVWMKAFKKTVETVFERTLAKSGQLSLHMLWNCVLFVLMLGGLGKICEVVTHSLAVGDDRDVFSPIAKHRLLESSYIDMRQVGPKKMD